MKLPKIQKIQSLDPNGIYWVKVGDKDNCPSPEEITRLHNHLTKRFKGIKWIVAPHSVKLSNENKRHAKT